LAVALPRVTGVALRDIAFASVLALAFSVPLEGMIVVPGVGSLSVFAGVVSAASTAAYLLVQQSVRKILLEHWLVLLFAVWSGMTATWSLAPEASLTRFASFLQLWLFLFVFWQCGDTENRQVILMKAYVLGSFVVAVVLINSMVNFDPSTMQDGEIRFSAFGINPNEQAMGLVIAIPMAAYLVVCSRKLAKMFFVIVIPVLAGGVLITLSRGAFVAMLVALVVSVIMLHKLGERRTAYLFVLSGVALIVFGIALNLDQILARVLSVVTMVASGDLNHREFVWKTAIEQLPQSWLGGVGAGAFASMTGGFLSEPTSAHNTYLSVLLETGVIGFLLFFSPLSLVLKRALLADYRHRMVIMAVALPLALGSVVIQFEHKKPFWFAFAIALGLSTLSRRAGVKANHE
jgi:O-antigen ligase